MTFYGVLKRELDMVEKEKDEFISDLSKFDQRKNKTPKKLAIIVPSFASIEEIRTLFPKNILSEDASSMEKKSTN
ncbi:hypothetical protein Bca52824_026257 [Brassica carinata]|uniref:Uncharacterized protein n=1 Tax=Brassica carinata TaxID=52824 RepID=A0A8X7V8P2_BRACI|nr:hypothetical protein Bca52824_026257 [Brassica carinata]